jgi:hypothetical protein
MVQRPAHNLVYQHIYGNRMMHCANRRPERVVRMDLGIGRVSGCWCVGCLAGRR